MRAVNQPAEQESCYPLKSPLLFGVLQALDPDTRIDVLDLTPAYAGILEFFSQYHCKLFLPGCKEQLLAVHLDEEEDDSALIRKIEACIPMQADKHNALDLLLLWDLPNYLDQRVLPALIKYLASQADERTVLHTYIHTRQTMPARPGDYRLTSEQAIRVNLSAPWTARSPAYHQAMLNKLFSPFRVTRGMLLANGFQEYLLRLN